MTIDEAKSAVLSRYKDYRAIMCRLYRDWFVFSIVPKDAKQSWRTSKVWSFPVGSVIEIPVNSKTGKINTNFNSGFDISDEDIDEYDNAEVIYYEDLKPPKK